MHVADAPEAREKVRQRIAVVWVLLVLLVEWLKGHCHATWQDFKKPEGVFGSIEFQN